MQKYFVASDLHMGDGSESDDFKPNKKRFLEFLKHVRGEGGVLILAGDIFELWQADLQSILKANAELIELLFKIRPIILIGNHDYYLKTFTDLSFVFYPSYHIQDLKIWIEHGHEYDPNNDPNQNMKLGRTVTALGGLAEKWIDKDIDRKFMDLYKDVKDKYSEFWNEVESPFVKKKRTGQEADITPYKTNAQNVIEENESVARVVFGHTHKPEIALDGTYINTGAWVDDYTSFVEITDTDISLCTFRTRSNIRTIDKVEI